MHLSNLQCFYSTECKYHNIKHKKKYLQDVRIPWWNPECVKTTLIVLHAYETISLKKVEEKEATELCVQLWGGEESVKLKPKKIASTVLSS